MEEEDPEMLEPLDLELEALQPQHNKHIKCYKPLLEEPLLGVEATTLLWESLEEWVVQEVQEVLVDLEEDNQGEDNNRIQERMQMPS